MNRELQLNISNIKADGVFDAPGYAQAFRVDAIGSLVFLSGQVALTPEGEPAHIGDFEAQATAVFGCVKALVESAGSNLQKIVKVTIFLTDISHRPALAEIRKKVFGAQTPPTTLVVVKALARPEWLLEVEAIAAV